MTNIKLDNDELVILSDLMDTFYSNLEFNTEMAPITEMYMEERFGTTDMNEVMNISDNEIFSQKLIEHPLCREYVQQAKDCDPNAPDTKNQLLLSIPDICLSALAPDKKVNDRLLPEEQIRVLITDYLANHDAAYLAKYRITLLELHTIWSMPHLVLYMWEHIDENLTFSRTVTPSLTPHIIKQIMKKFHEMLDNMTPRTIIATAPPDLFC